MKWPELNSELTALKAFKAEFDVKQQDVPKTANEYKIEVKGVEVPDGYELAINKDHPMAKPVMEWASKHNMTQEAVNELVAIQAKTEIAKAQEFKAALAEERGKLGDSGQARIDAVKTALTGRLGPRANPLIAGLVSAEQVESYEALLRSTFAPAPNANPNSGKPDFSKMTAMEKLHYAHSQQKSA